MVTSGGGGMGAVLMAGENEALFSTTEIAKGDLEVITRSLIIWAEPPVALVDKVVDRRGTRALAEAYVNFLYTPQGQGLAAENYLCPSDPQIFLAYGQRVPKVEMLSIAGFGGWRAAPKKQFWGGGVF